MNRFPQRRRAVFIVLLCGAVAAALGYVLLSPSRNAGTQPVRQPAAAPENRAPNQQLLFRITALGPSYGRLGLVPLTDAVGPVRDVGLVCDRVHVANENGICLSADRGVVTTYSALLFDADFTVRHTLPLKGAPSRARVSPDGRRGAITLFAGGESYEGAAALMRTLIVDMTTGTTTAQLEDFTIYRGDVTLPRADASFRGVTFAPDGHRFYAALRTGGRTHLVEGDLDARTARIIADDVDGPSLSPDDTRIAFTRGVANGGPAPRLQVLTLQGREVTPLAETRAVDDQVEWLDNGRILYSLPHGSGSSAVWSVAADGTGEPTLVRVDAYSPTVVR